MSNIEKTYSNKKSFEYDKKRMQNKGYHISNSTIYIGKLKVEYQKKNRNKISNIEILNEIKQEISNRASTCITKIKHNGINSFDAGKAVGLQEAMSIINNVIYKYNYKK